MKEAYSLITPFLDKLIIEKGLTEREINETLVFILEEQEVLKWKKTIL